MAETKPIYKKTKVVIAASTMAINIILVLVGIFVPEVKAHLSKLLPMTAALGAMVITGHVVTEAVFINKK